MARRARTVCSGSARGRIAARRHELDDPRTQALRARAGPARITAPADVRIRRRADTETATIADAKSVIFDGFSRSLTAGAPSDAAGILVDEQYGAEIARMALARACIVAMPVERSDSPSFEFE
jgi:myo-inositol catabolism protein IolC